MRIDHFLYPRDNPVVDLLSADFHGPKFTKSFLPCPAKNEGHKKLGEGGRDSQRADAPGEGRAKREPARAKPQKKSSQILRPSPFPLPDGEGSLTQFDVPFTCGAIFASSRSGATSLCPPTIRSNWMFALLMPVKCVTAFSTHRAFVV